MIARQRFDFASTPRAPALVAWAMIGCVLSLTTHADDMQSELRRYNALKLSEGAQLYGADNGEAEAFKGYDFVCRRQADHVPAETPAARAAFQRFVEEVRAHAEPDEGDRQRRMDLLTQAIAAGSWRARYLDASWAIWLDPYGAEAREQFEVISDMAREGNPAGLQGLLRWTNGMIEDMPQRILILKAAIERGNPQTLSTVGFNLGARTRELRPMGIRMLECAAAQGDSDAHEGLGRIAWLEGRWVDAYLAWQRGANLGSDDCLTHMEDIVLTRPGYSPSVGTRGEDPKIAALREHYESQMLYTISELPELRVPAPQTLHLHWNDEHVVAVIKARIRTYGLP